MGNLAWKLHFFQDFFGMSIPEKFMKLGENRKPLRQPELHIRKDAPMMWSSICLLSFNAAD
ncbi:hypothetical protein CXU12_10560 [Akkermansia muciniphila]|nr:hypothetical protein CXU12_10560 [Akkermansia muciniphila]